VHLIDGTVIEGRHVTHTPLVEETAERSIVLAPPLSSQLAGADRAAPIDAQRLVIAADRVGYLAVRYFTPDPPTDAPAP
jgi:hypothetical protein